MPNNNMSNLFTINFSTVNRLYIQICCNNIELYFEWSINDKNRAFNNQSMTNTSKVNCFAQAFNDEKGSFCQDAD